MSAPTARAVLEGSVQGVVVQARKYVFSRSLTLNWATAEVSEISLYAPGMLSSAVLSPVPAAGE